MRNEMKAKSIIEQDSNGNYTHFKSDDYECWREFDERGNLIHYRNTNGKERYYEYDERNNLLTSRFNTGYVANYEYDEKNNIIHFHTNRGIESFNNYDEKDNLIYHCCIDDGSITVDYYTYDSNGNKIFSRSNSLHGLGVVTKECRYFYDRNNNLVYESDSDGSVNHYFYNPLIKKTALLFSRDDVYEDVIIERDSNDNIVHIGISVFDCWCDYDERNQLIRYRNTLGYDYSYSYDDRGNCILLQYANVVPYASDTQDICEYDENNRVTYISRCYGGEERFKYDENGRKIYYSCTDPETELIEEWNDYDENGKLIHQIWKDKASNCGEDWFKYDKNDKVIYHTSADGYERWTDWQPNSKYCKIDSWHN